MSDIGKYLHSFVRDSSPFFGGRAKCQLRDTLA